MIARVIGMALLLVAMLAGDVAALSPHIRDGWIVGISYGYGRGKFSVFDPDVQGETLATDWERGAVPQMRFGRVLVKNHLMVTAENRQWIIEQGILVEDKIRLNIQNWTLALTYFPGNPYSAAGGFFMQAGAGAANARVAILEPLVDDPYGDQFEEIFVQNEKGTGYFGGIGYEFRIMPKVAAGVAASFVYQTISGDIFDDAYSWPVTMTLNWYW